MAEYIDKMEALNKLQGRKTIELVMNIKPSDVIERSTILSAIEKMNNIDVKKYNSISLIKSKFIEILCIEILQEKF